jgi:hypothetical protein
MSFIPSWNYLGIISRYGYVTAKMGPQAKAIAVRGGRPYSRMFKKISLIFFIVIDVNKCPESENHVFGA